VPLTIGMVWMLVIMESVYVMTGKPIYKDMTRFWGKLFGINFALGVTTGITMEFQFGTNWAYYSHYVGDIFGAPLAIEGLMAFFLESTLIGLFFFGWDRLSRKQHLLVTILMAIGTNLSALWILIANGWMQNPVGAEFSYVTMRMEMTDFGPCCSTRTPRPSSCTPCRPAMSPGRCSCCRFQPGTCCAAATWSLPSAASASPPPSALPRVLGDRAGRRIRLHRGRGPADQAGGHGGHVGNRTGARAFNLVAIPNEAEMKNDFAIEIPWVMGLIGTRSLDKQIPGIKEIARRTANASFRHQAVTALEALRKNPEEGRQGRLRGAQGRSRLRAAAQEIRHGHA
jgi:cytochrome d ubiquinol oxidase subunit I